MERNWHPDSLKFDLLDGADKEVLKKSLGETKGNKDDPIEYRMLKGTRQYLDGRNRAMCCDELGIKPKEKLVNVKDKDLRAYYIRKNVARRHMLAKARKAWVDELAADGQSTREIAETLGVSHTTIVRDLSDSGTNVPVSENGQSTNAGSSERKQPPKILCPACITKERKGQARPSSCIDCKALRKQAKEEEKSGTNQDADVVAEEPEEVKDEAGHKVPGTALAAFATCAKFEQMESHCRSLQRLIDETARLPGGEQLARFLKATGSAEKVIHKSEHLNALKRDLKGTRPYSICPRCKGKGGECKGCSGNTWVSKVTWDNFEDSIKARIS